MPRRKIIDRTVKLGVSYARFSTDRQTSCKQQHATNDTTADEFGCRIVKRFGDEAKSRSIDDRAGLLEMFAYLEAHPEVGCIVVNELERLTSGIMQRAKVIELCRRLQITILTEDIGDIDPNDEKKMNEADDRAVKAEGELIRARRRTKRHMKALASEPGKYIKRPCFGMRIVPLDPRTGEPLETAEALRTQLGAFADGRVMRTGDWELHPTEYPWLVKIFAMADQGVPDHHIARYLVENRVRTKTGLMHWTPATVRNMITNEFYKGIYEYGANEVKRDGQFKYTEPRPDVHPNRITRPSPLGEMIDAELWERVNNRRIVRAATGDNRYLQTGRRSVEAQVFDGRVFCARCGYKMYGNFDLARRKHVNQTPPFRYTCKKGAATQRVRKDDFGPPCTTSQSITATQIIEALSAFGPETAEHVVDPIRNDVDRLLAWKEATAEAGRAKARFERTKAMHQSDPDLASLAEVRAEKTKWDRAAQTAEALHKAEASGPGIPRGWEKVDWAGLGAVLAGAALPVSDRAQVLTDAGIERLYIDFPLVHPQFAGG